MLWGNQGSSCLRHAEEPTRIVQKLKHFFLWENVSFFAAQKKIVNEILLNCIIFPDIFFSIFYGAQSLYIMMDFMTTFSNLYIMYFDICPSALSFSFLPLILSLLFSLKIYFLPPFPIPVCTYVYEHVHGVPEEAREELEMQGVVGSLMWVLRTERRCPGSTRSA